MTALCVNSQHLEDESKAAQHSVGLRRQLDGESVEGRADEQTVDEVGFAVPARRAALPPGVGRVVSLQLNQDLAGVDDRGRRGKGQGGRRGGDGDGRCGVRGGGGRRLRRTGIGGEGEEGGRRRRGGLGAQQAERHGRFAVILLLAPVSDLLKAGGVVTTAEREGNEGKVIRHIQNLQQQRAYVNVNNDFRRTKCDNKRENKDRVRARRDGYHSDGSFVCCSFGKIS